MNLTDIHDPITKNINIVYLVLQFPIKWRDINDPLTTLVLPHGDLETSDA